MKSIFILISLLLLAAITQAQQSYNITFAHDGKTVFGTFTTPNGTGKFPTIIINPGSGANDRDGTFPVTSGNASCLYPGLVGDTLRFYEELSDALVDSGYAVLRYDKLEYTYPTNLGAITFHKLWLPVESAIDYIKTRNDVDTNRIILIGHSEGSSLIPFIAKGRSDIKALISIGGNRTPFDSLLAYQIVYIAQTCGGNVSQAQTQANQILSYFNIIRTNTWNGSTPTFLGAPASAWYDYVLATDSVVINYNINNLPTLFIGMALDVNVPPAELIRFQNEVTITNDFWSMPGLNHYMTPSNDPHVSTALTDTVIYWLRQNNFTTGINSPENAENPIQVFPNPFKNILSVTANNNFQTLTFSVLNTLGQEVFRKQETNLSKNSTLSLNLQNLPVGIYFLQVTADNQSMSRKIVKQ